MLLGNKKKNIVNVSSKLLFTFIVVRNIVVAEFVAHITELSISQ